jgi:hypothetical protein
MQLLLFFVITLLFVRITDSFVFLQRQTKIQKQTKLKYYYNQEYPSDYNNPPYNYDNYNEDYNDNNNYNEDLPLFIVIWRKTTKTENLLLEMEKQGLNTVFIPEDEVDSAFQITTEDMPLVYKEEVLLESWMDIYAEMYPI